MTPNNYITLSDDGHDVLEQDDVLRHVYIEQLGLLHDLLSPYASEFMETVYDAESIPPRLAELASILRESGAVGHGVDANIELAQHLIEIDEPGLVDNFLEAVQQDYCDIRQIRSKDCELA